MTRFALEKECPALGVNSRGRLEVGGQLVRAGGLTEVVALGREGSRSLRESLCVFHPNPGVGLVGAIRVRNRRNNSVIREGQALVYCTSIFQVNQLRFREVENFF